VALFKQVVPNPLFGKTKKQTYLLLLVFALCSNVFAQPANDDPCNAIALTVAATCTYTTYTNAAATASTGVPAPGCANYLGGDVWFTVVVRQVVLLQLIARRVL
jgi:hypothetical protein